MLAPVLEFDAVLTTIQPKGLGVLEKLPEDLIYKIFKDFLCANDYIHFLAICKAVKRLKPRLWDDYTRRYLLPVEAFGNLAMCREILPMPKQLKNILSGPDGDLYTPFLRTSRFMIEKLDGTREIFPANYEGLEKASRLRGGIGYESLENGLKEGEGGVCKLQEMRWVLMTRDVLLGSRVLRYQDAQERFVTNWILENPSLREGFSMPEDPRDVVYMLFYRYCSDQVRLCSDEPCTFMWSLTKVRSFNLAVGGFSPEGLCVLRGAYFLPFRGVGVGVQKKF